MCAVDTTFFKSNMATTDSRHGPRSCIKLTLVLMVLLIIFQLVCYFMIENKRLWKIYDDIELIRNYSGMIASKLRGRWRQINTTENMKAMKTDVFGVTNRTDILPECPPSPPRLVGPLSTYRHTPTFKEMEAELKYLMPGGHFSPKECGTEQRVAIVIPYRNRISHLQMVLYNLHTMLKRQQINYGIFVIEQAGNNTFNRGLLMNIGYAEAIKSYNYTCFVFHDVDLIPEDDRIYYGCGPNPRHLSAAVDKFNYKLPYGGIAGGVTQLRRCDVEKINGYSNLYFGWGGEDDDLSIRLRSASLKIERYSMAISRYRMIKHGKEKGNAPNPARLGLLGRAASRMKTDGLNNLKYRVLNTNRGKLFTNVTVEINRRDYNVTI